MPIWTGWPLLRRREFPAALRWLHSGGAMPVAAPAFVNRRSIPDMYPGRSWAERIQAGIDALSAAGGGTLHLDGRVFEVDRTILLRPAVTLDGGCGGFRAMPGFSGSEVVRGDTQHIAYNALGYARASSLLNLVIDCNRQTGVRGLYQRNVQKDRVTGLRIRNCLADGWVVDGGYEMIAHDFEVIAATRRDGGIAPAPLRRGLICSASDSHFSDGVLQHFPIGVFLPGAHNHCARLHAWSTYYAADPPMLIGFLCHGEANTFTACSADSPRLLDNAVPVSHENGGYGFLLELHAINTRLIACTVQMADFGDSGALPPKSTVVPVYCGQVRTTIVGLETRDHGKAGFAVPVQAPSDGVLRETTILGGNVHEGMPHSMLLPGQEVAPFAPQLRIGEATRPRQIRQSGLAKRVAGMTFFEISLDLAERGAGQGAVTIDGLPDIPVAGLPGHCAAFVPALRGWAGRNPVVALLQAGRQDICLVHQFTGASVTERDLTDAAGLTLAGHYTTHAVGLA
ncbi:hypothetical protein QMO56_18025 [Roseomonas sp. E05]|uniref:hypothetical protein n=1 Tax=Roseomonas sp. E05 TaxID=3046310 RepID=UPI0024B9C62B|nr:hypothetical protein [Roseomonas sp. E05]MDJ0390009.1 hypothetical protein [Roseomonas sp. E05]